MIADPMMKQSLNQKNTMENAIHLNKINSNYRLILPDYNTTPINERVGATKSKDFFQLADWVSNMFINKRFHLYLESLTGCKINWPKKPIS